MDEALLTARDESEAAAQLVQGGFTDGLPVVVPTRERVDRMVLTGGLDPDLILGAVGPGGGEATVLKVATNAVMAGCPPDAFPVVVAAVRAICSDTFDLTEVQATTHSLGPVVIVNGEARACGPIHSGWGALGPCDGANLAVGRALRLLMLNLGLAQPGVVDMATLGHPGKLSMCFAEAEEDSPFPPLQTSRGYASDDATVTVVAAEAPHSVLCLIDSDEPASDRLLDLLAGAASVPAANNAYFGEVGGGHVVFVLTPLHAEVLADAGLDREAIQHELYARARNRRGELRRLNPALVESGEDQDMVPALAGPEAALVVVAGGRGYYSAVMPSWGHGQHRNVAVTEPVILNQACAVPWMD